ncbi:MAG TPA: Sua5/YciO/YrdC/YwlC family protein, partial [Trichocoleus sp.]
MSIFPFTSQSAAVAQSTEILRLQSGPHGAKWQPAIYRLAKQYDLNGEVRSEGGETFVVASGPQSAIDQLVEALRSQFPALASASAITRQPCPGEPALSDFAWPPMAQGSALSLIPADLAICKDCLQEVFDPASRYYRYPFTSCSCCGPRFSLAQSLPYGRSRTSLAAFPLCDQCQQDYEIADRRHHASALACPVCGPQVRLVRTGSGALTSKTPPFNPSPIANNAADDVTADTTADDMAAVCALLQQGELVAIKGLSGFYLACDATHEKAVRQLRQRLGGQPLTLMAQNSTVVQRYCRVTPAEKALLESPMAPVVLLKPKHSQLPGFWLEAEFLSFHRGDFADQIPAAWEPDSGWSPRGDSWQSSPAAFNQSNLSA